MKRKYDLRNKRNFLIILILGLFIIGIFSLFIYKYLHASKITYDVPIGSILQDTNKNFINVEDRAHLGTRWNGAYYLAYQDSKVNLGKRVIVYDTTTGKIHLYGRFYRINETGKIVELNDETIIDSASDASFYKLADREYLLVDRRIVSDDNSINTSNYLLVELDRMGNAKLSNNKLNLKTIAPTKLSTTKYTFDIANERLKYNKLDIDLKKIIGSTNEYKEEEKKEEPVDTSRNAADINNWMNNNNINPQEIGGGIINNNEDEGTITTLDEIKNKVKSTSVIRWHQGLTSIDIDYVVYDPYDEFNSLYINISGNVGKIDLNKMETHKTISGLIPDREYTLSFVYTTVDREKHMVLPTTFDELTIKTAKPVYSGKVIGYSADTHNLTYRVDLQKDYQINQIKGTLIVYHRVHTDNGLVEKREEIPLTINVSGMNSVITGTINLAEKGINDVVKLDMAKVIINSVSSGSTVITY